MEESQLQLFVVPKLEKAGCRRRTRTSAASCDEEITCRRDRVTKRNRLMTARYYYWTEIQRRRFDDTLRILADREFFIEERTIANALLEQDDYYRELIDTKTSRRQLRRLYPGYEWN